MLGCKGRHSATLPTVRSHNLFSKLETPRVTIYPSASTCVLWMTFPLGLRSPEFLGRA